MASSFGLYILILTLPQPMTKLEIVRITRFTDLVQGLLPGRFLHSEG